MSTRHLRFITSSRHGHHAHHRAPRWLARHADAALRRDLIMAAIVARYTMRRMSNMFDKTAGDYVIRTMPRAFVMPHSADVYLSRYASA